MLFRQRTLPSVAERLRLMAWPRRSWSRSYRYLGKRVVRLAGSPHAIAVGFAAGILVSWTPLLGFHIVLAAVIAFLLGGSLVASLLGTLIGNPLTFPLMWWSSYTVGHHILRVREPVMSVAAMGHMSFTHILPVLKPMLIGAGILGALSGLLAYGLVRGSVAGYRRARRDRLTARRTARVVTAPSE